MSKRAPYSVFTRLHKASGKTVFYAKFFDDDGELVKTITLKECQSRVSACRAAEKYLAKGVVRRDEDENLYAYLLRFWDKGSDYVLGRSLRGVSMSDEYLYNSRQIVKTILEPHTKNMRLTEITAKWAEKLILSLHKAGYSATRITAAMQVLRVPYRYHCRMNHIPDQLAMVEGLRITRRERGILSVEEIGKLIAVDESPVIKAGVLLACLCGLRMGECRGLMPDDIDYGKFLLYIQHNVVSPKIVKQPKWNSTRTVPCPQVVVDALKLCIESSPHKDGKFVLWNQVRPDRPVEDSSLRIGFHRMLKTIGIDESERLQRNIVFHGLRHTFVSLARSQGVPDFVVQALAGHSSLSMTEKYSHTSITDFETARAKLESAIKESQQAK